MRGMKSRNIRNPLIAAQQGPVTSFDAQAPLEELSATLPGCSEEA